MEKSFNKLVVSKTEHIFEKLFNITIKPKEIYKKTKESEDWDISGVVGVTGHYNGVIVLRAKDDLCIKLLNISTLSSDKGRAVNDIVGEVINNIAGNVLSESNGIDFKNSVPITIRGKNHKLNWPIDNPMTVIPFILDKGYFEVQYSLVER